MGLSLSYTGSKLEYNTKPHLLMLYEIKTALPLCSTEGEVGAEVSKALLMSILD